MKGDTKLHDGVTMRSSAALTVGDSTSGGLAVVNRKTGKEIPVESWAGSSYGWFASNAPASLRGRKFLLVDGAVYVSGRR